MSRLGQFKWVCELCIWSSPINLTSSFGLLKEPRNLSRHWPDPGTCGLDLSPNECRTWAGFSRSEFSPFAIRPNLVTPVLPRCIIDSLYAFWESNLLLRQSSKFDVGPQSQETWAQMFYTEPRKAEGKVESYRWGPPFQQTVSLWIFVLFTPVNVPFFLGRKANTFRLVVLSTMQLIGPFSNLVIGLFGPRRWMLLLSFFLFF